jgi:hypothetical protein
MCLRFRFCTHQRVCILYFLKKSQIRCTLLHSLLKLAASLFFLNRYCSSFAIPCSQLSSCSAFFASPSSLQFHVFFYWSYFWQSNPVLLFLLSSYSLAYFHKLMFFNQAFSTINYFSISPAISLSRQVLSNGYFMLSFNCLSIHVLPYSVAFWSSYANLL